MACLLKAAVIQKIQILGKRQGIILVVVVSLPPHYVHKINYFTSKFSLFWEVKQGRLVNDVSGQPVGPVFKFL
jgi:hypothetical protein